MRLQLALQQRVAAIPANGQENSCKEMRRDVKSLA
jgi:hypothetical protein